MTTREQLENAVADAIRRDDYDDAERLCLLAFEQDPASAQRILNALQAALWIVDGPREDA